MNKLETFLATGEWEIVVNHRCDLLTEHMIYRGLVQHIRLTEFGFSFDTFDSLFDSATGDIWWRKTQLRELEERLLSPEQYQEIIKRAQSGLDAYRVYLEEFQQRGEQAKNKPEIIEEFFRRSEQTVSAIFFFQLEKGLSKELERQGISAQSVRSSLTDTPRASQELHRIATEHALEMAPDYAKKQTLSWELRQKLEGFCQRFGYLAMKYFLGHPWTVWEAYEMAQSAALHAPKAIVESSPSDSPYVRALEEILRLRTETWETMCYGCSLFRTMVIERFPGVVVYEDLLKLQVDEVIAFFRGQFPHRSLLDTRDAFVISALQGEVDMWVQEVRQEAPVIVSNSFELKGVTAQPGVVRGKAKIVMSPKEGSKVLAGDILVATMSTPDFLPAMMRAAAFVTDIGGITSHAAIVSREMGKPCVIGTKTATKVFKDGDLIEVDATKGIVRRI